ncbi:MAG: hypothetical protein ACREO8_06700 [Luteimonas sp.]
MSGHYNNRPTAGMVLARLLMTSGFVVMGSWRLAAAALGDDIANGTLVFSAIEVLLGLLIASGWRLRWTATAAALLLLGDAALSHPFGRSPNPSAPRSCCTS